MLTDIVSKFININKLFKLLTNILNCKEILQTVKNYITDPSIVVDEVKKIGALGCDVKESQEEPGRADPQGDPLLVPLGKLVANDGDDGPGERRSTSHAQREQHQEEEHREDLRHPIKSCQNIRIRNKRQRSPASYNTIEGIK